MVIEGYTFGRMDIGGTTFNSDVIIFPERVKSPWWRGEGHFLQLRDIEDILEYRPEVLIIGTGYYRQMKVAPEVEDKLKEMNIDYYIVDCREGVELYNTIEKKRKVGAFHLTC